MKKLISMALVLMIIAATLLVVSLPAFAEEGGSMSSAEQTLEGLKADLKGVVDKVIAFIKSDETYTNIATILLAVLLIIFVPILIGVFFLVYLVVAVMTLFASALVAVIEVLSGLLLGAVFI